MNHRRNNEPRTNRDRWLVSYADFITLLFALFVVMFASSQMDRAKMGKMSAAIEGAFQKMGVFNGVNGRQSAGATRGSTEAVVPANVTPIATERAGFTRQEIQALKDELESALASEIEKREVALRVGPEGLVVSLREIGFFNSGSSTLKPGSESTIARIATVLRDKPVGMRVEGHTDNVPIHTKDFSSNWELSTARATEMIRILMTKYNFPPERLSAAGYGAFHPIALNSTAEGRRENRRVDLIILAAQSQGGEQRSDMRRNGKTLGAAARGQR